MGGDCTLDDRLGHQEIGSTQTSAEESDDSGGSEEMSIIFYLLTIIFPSIQGGNIIIHVQYKMTHL